jgi:hypothetical protein
MGEPVRRIRWSPGGPAAVEPGLRFLLPRRCLERGEVDLPRDPAATVGHLVQSVGVPLTEIGDLVMAGVPVSGRNRRQDQDRLDAFVRQGRNL